MSLQIEFYDEIKQRLEEVNCPDNNLRAAAEQDIRRMRDENVVSNHSVALSQLAQMAVEYLSAKLTLHFC